MLKILFICWVYWCWIGIQIIRNTRNAHASAHQYVWWAVCYCSTFFVTNKLHSTLAKKHGISKLQVWKNRGKVSIYFQTIEVNNKINDHIIANGQPVSFVCVFVLTQMSLLTSLFTKNPNNNNNTCNMPPMSTQQHLRVLVSYVGYRSIFWQCYG